MSADGSPSPSPPPPPSAHGTREPRPAARWEDAFLRGNGRHGAMAFGDPDDDRVVVTHHTLARPKGGEHAGPSEPAAQLPQLQDRLLAGDLTAAEEFTDVRPPQWVQPFHPAFIETLIQSTPDRLVLLPALPALPAAFPAGARAVVRPTRTHRVDLRTSSGARPLDLRAGEDRVLTLGPR